MRHDFGDADNRLSALDYTYVVLFMSGVFRRAWE